MTPKVERLVNLTVALLEAPRPLTFQELRQRTGFYAQGDFAAARRMFERDKDDLRRLGVPVETRAADAFEAELGYLVDRRAYELPDVDLDPGEMTALALALQVAGDPTSRTALAKLGARAPDPQPVASLPARMDLDAESIDDLAESLLLRCPVRFGYRGRAAATEARTVDPYAVVYRRGAWYLVGRDHDRDDVRVFRLDRMEGRAQLAGGPGSFEPPGDLDPAAHVGSRDQIDAEIAVASEVTWEADLEGGTDTGRRHRGRHVYRFAAASPWRLSPWALARATDVEVLAPASLRDHVRQQLRAMADRP